MRGHNELAGEVGPGAGGGLEVGTDRCGGILRGGQRDVGGILDPLARLCVSPEGWLGGIVGGLCGCCKGSASGGKRRSNSLRPLLPRQSHPGTTLWGP